MITLSHPLAPQFAGKNKKTNALLAGLLLSSAGVAALPTRNSNTLSLSGAHNNTLPDSFSYTPEPKKESLLDKITGHHSEATSDKQLEARQQVENYLSFDDAPPLYLEDDSKDAASRVALKKAPFSPKDINLFSTPSYPSSKPMTTPPVTEISEGQLKDNLLSVLTKRFKGDESKAKKAAEIFDSSELKAIIPDPKLRAALVNLRGTTGRSAIDAYAGQIYSTVDFSNEVGNQTIARVLTQPGVKPRVAFNPRYKGEDFQLLSATIAHEALHQDISVSDAEELIADAVDITIYAQQLLENPELSRQDTELTRRYNSKLMGRLNSRDENGNPSIFKSKGNVFPGGSLAANFGQFRNMNSSDSAIATPGNPHLQGMLKAITGKDISNPAFNKETLDLLDQNLKSLKPEQLVELASILKLDVGNMPANETTGESKDNPSNATSGANSAHKIPKALLLSLGLGLPAAKAAGII